MEERPTPNGSAPLTDEQRELLYSLHRNLKGSFLQFDKLCRDLAIVTSTKP